MPRNASVTGCTGRSLRPVCSKNSVVELFRNNLTNCELTSQVRKRRHSGVIASHSVDTATWGSGCSTKVKIGTRCAIEGGCGTEEKLPEIHGAYHKVTANQIWVPPLKRRGRGNGSGQNALAQVRSET